MINSSSNFLICSNMIHIPRDLKKKYQKQQTNNPSKGLIVKKKITKYGKKLFLLI